MTLPVTHKITVDISGAKPFKLPVDENEESFYRQIIEKINENCRRFQSGIEADDEQVALAKVALFYATMFYRRHDLVCRQGALLDAFEQRLDAFLGQFDTGTPQ